MSTRSCWYGEGDKGEIVELTFDPQVVSYAELVKTGVECGCADKIFAVDDAQMKVLRELAPALAATFSGKRRADKQPKYYLFVTDLRSVPMTELQAVRVNSVLDRKDLIAKRAYAEFLSPCQLELLAAVRKQPELKWPNLVGVPLAESWKRALAVRQPK